ncbi:AIPR family protein [Mesorhizobium sp. B2-4-16]|uniref:AIPR family protein n=1 Tax=Mesorhizobium sp. B2-4-16 TaxID=2589933 RepID=UPI001129B773|nr:AIPR family protein [Mesorhizobium sp. B2-4-16]TPK89840.1 AIPR family protein [Mesorhizobium sp. B2-4-16]
MSAIDQEEAFVRFWDDLLFQAEASAEPQAAAFFRLYAKLAAENGDCIDLAYTPVRHEGRGGYQLDGFALETERGDLFLAISDFRPGRELETLNAAQIDALFERVRRFCELAVQPTFINAIEETSPTFEAAWPIYSNRARIRRIRVIAFSNARLSTRRKPETTGEVLGVPVVCSVLDFVRYSDISASKTGQEPIEIDVVDLTGSALPCLPAHSIDGKQASYLLAVPGTFLAQIYGLYGAQLLEQNVRTFLQARTKVNTGIIKTLETQPEMFFAYNNGLTATAANITKTRLADGSLGIAAIENLQIVNGGQTTASILYASDAQRKDRRADLSRVFVQMKLSVVNPDLLDDIVPKISRFANTQNKISEADFFSSHPIHLVLQQISRQLWAPAKPGSLSGSKWFYERARGQYRDRLAYGTDAERRRFELEFPRSQLIEKTDLAKFEVTFECRPHIVSRHAQKCFLEYAETIDRAWKISEAQFNEHWFRGIVAKAIAFRWTDRMVGGSAWYQEDRGYKAQVVTYTLAWLVNYLYERDLELDLEVIWQRQDLPDEIGEVLRQLAPQVSATLKDAPPQMKNVGEYCKQQACWAAVAGAEYRFAGSLDGLVVDRAQAEHRRKEAIAAKKLDSDIDLDRLMVAMLEDTEPYMTFASGKRLLTPKSVAALRRLTRGDIRLPVSERNALKYMLEKMQRAGFELPDAAKVTLGEAEAQ